MINILIFIITTNLLINLFMLYRNEWVYKNCVALICKDLNLYNTLPSYEKMLFQFWIWDINKFIKESNEPK